MLDTEAAAPKGFSLRQKIAALTAAMVLMAVAGLVAVQMWSLRATAVEAGLSAQRTTAGLVADQIAGGVKWGKLDLVQGVIARMTAQTDHRIAHVQVFDPAGGTLVIWPEGPEEAEVRDARAAAVAGQPPASVVTADHVMVAAPVGEIATVVVAWDLDVVTAAARMKGALSLACGLIAALLIVGVMVWFMNRAVLRAVVNLTNGMSRLAGGDTDIALPCVARGDEIGRMARAVALFKDAFIQKRELERDAEQARVATEAERRTVEAEREAAAQEQAEAVGQLGTALSRLAQGDLTHRISGRFPENYGRLRDDLNAAFEALQEAMGRIAVNAETVRAAAGKISGASDELSQRTESQAASLEQSAAAIEEIAATTRKTADGAAHAREVVDRAKAEAESGGDVARDAVLAMSEIEGSSEKIGQIIGVIDEIAFQTNLLALNAGVEAARAGEAGRGFAVVASEVRALAQRSADAAKQIKALIMSSKTQVERGVELVGGAGEALSRIIAGVAEINDAVAEIATSAREQATGLQEVSGAVGQMDQITQQNAAMVEQVTASVRALSNQTDEFADLVSRFKTGARVAAPAPAAPRAAGPAPRPSASVTPLRAAPPRRAAMRTADASPKLAVPATKRAAATSDAGWEEF